MKNPLKSIIAFSESLLQKLCPHCLSNDAGGISNIQIIETLTSNSFMLLMYVNDLMDIHAIKLGRLSKNFSEFKVTDIFDKVKLMLRNQLESNRIDFQLRIDQDVTIRSDYQRI